MIFFLVPETKKRTLEELNFIFAIPTRTFASYQINVVVPWVVRRWLLCDKRAKLAPLNRFGHGVPEETLTKA